jgi:hypothetical protein
MPKSVNPSHTTNGHTPNDYSLDLPPDEVTLLSPLAISETDREMALNLITQLRALIPLQSLKASDRRSLSGMGDKNRIFVTKVIEVIDQNPGFLPQAFEADKLRQAMASYERLNSILMALHQVSALMDATAISLGSEAYDLAREAYRYAKASDQGANLEGIVEDMGRRYARKTKKSKADETPAAE